MTIEWCKADQSAHFQIDAQNPVTIAKDITPGQKNINSVTFTSFMLVFSNFLGWFAFMVLAPGMEIKIEARKHANPPDVRFFLYFYKILS